MSISKQLIYVGLLALSLVGSPRALGQLPTKGSKGLSTDSVSREDKASDYYYRGVLAQRLGRTEEALDLLKRAHTLIPGDPIVGLIVRRWPLPQLSPRPTLLQSGWRMPYG